MSGGSKFQSMQEELLHAHAVGSLGGCRIFQPAKFSMNREPADLAYSYGDNAILFYCTQGNKSRNQQDNHNLNQLRGWMRRWTGGVNLNGTIGDEKVEIEYGINLNIYAISICDANDNREILCHPSDYKNLKIYNHVRIKKQSSTNW